MARVNPRVYVNVAHRDAIEDIEDHAASRGGWEVLFKPGFLDEGEFLR